MCRAAQQGNWRWRFDAGLLRPELAKKLAALAEVCDRLPQPLPTAQSLQLEEYRPSE